MLTFYQSENGLPRRIGWNNASTFTGFCGFHNNNTFEPLENYPFTQTDQQCFLIGYRALCHEIYQKRLFLHSDQIYLEIIKSLASYEDSEYLEQLNRLMNNGAKKGLLEFQNLKKIMDGQLLNEKYDGWSKYIVKFSGDLCVASTGLVSVTRDLDGNILQELHDPNSDQQSLLYGMTCDDQVGYVVLIWPDYQDAPKKFIESVIARGENKLSDILVQFMFAFVENTYFALVWWDTLSEEQKNHLTKLALMPPNVTYYSDIPYKFEQFVPWKILETTYC